LWKSCLVRYQRRSDAKTPHFSKKRQPNASKKRWKTWVKFRYYWSILDFFCSFDILDTHFLYLHGLRLFPGGSKLNVFHFFQKVSVWRFFNNVFGSAGAQKSHSVGAQKRLLFGAQKRLSFGAQKRHSNSKASQHFGHWVINKKYHMVLLALYYTMIM